MHAAWAPGSSLLAMRPVTGGRITNAKPLSLPWLRAEDEFPAEVALGRGRLYGSHKTNRRLLTNLLALRFYERVRKQYHLPRNRRGVQAFGPVPLRAGDLFGFRRQERWLDYYDELVVYPRVVPWEALPPAPGHPFGDSLPLRRIVDDPLASPAPDPIYPATTRATCTGRQQRAAANCRPAPSNREQRRARPSFWMFRQCGAPGTVESYLEYAIVVAASLARTLLTATRGGGPVL